MRKIVLFASLIAVIAIMSFDTKPENVVVDQAQVGAMVEQSTFVCPDCGEVLEVKATNKALLLKCDCGFKDRIEVSRIYNSILMMESEVEGMECGKAYLTADDIWCQDCLTESGYIIILCL